MYKILVLDDDVLLREAIFAFLTNEKFSVISLESVYSVLIFIKKNCIDLIIADVMMPELDGYDLLNILRSFPIYNTVPVVLLTAKGITSDKVKGYDLGCNIYITKPFDPQELLSIINNLLHTNTHKTYRLDSKNKEIDLDYLETLNLVFTYREKSILNLVIKGYTNKEIASALQLSCRNVEKYVSRLLYKTHTRNRTELVKYILQR